MEHVAEIRNVNVTLLSSHITLATAITEFSAVISKGGGITWHVSIL
jgi:hypothetical protein